MVLTIGEKSPSAQIFAQVWRCWSDPPAAPPMTYVLAKARWLLELISSSRACTLTAGESEALTSLRRGHKEMKQNQ